MRHLRHIPGLKSKSVQHFLNQVCTVLLHIWRILLTIESQSRTSESVSLFEQAQRSFTASSKDREEKQKIARGLKKPNVRFDYGSDDWFDRQSYSNFAEFVEAKNPGIKIDKEIMDLAFEIEYTKFSKATIDVRKNKHEKMRDRVSAVEEVCYNS